MLLAVSRVQRVRAAVPRRGAQAPARRRCGPQDRRARPGLQGRHRRRARLAVAQARPAARARAGRRRRPRPARADADRSRSPRRVLDADAVVVATNHTEFRGPDVLARDRRQRAAGRADRRPVEHVRARRRSSRNPTSWRRWRPRSMNRVLVTGGAGTIGAAVVRRLLGDPDWEVRVSDQRTAAAVDARGLRGPHRRPARTSTRRAGRPTAARTSSTSPRSSAASRTSTSSRTR